VRANPTALLALLVCSLAPRLARGAPPEHLQLKGSSGCPSIADVLAELAPLLPHTHIEAGSDAAQATDVQNASVDDEGEGVRVRVANQERLFRDPERSCRERARTAAVFIGLVLDPPVLPEAKPPAPVAPPAAPAAAPPPPPAEAGAPLTLQLGPLFEAAPISDAAEVPRAGGFGGRLGWGRALGVAVGAAFLLPTRLALPRADARLVWLPFDVSLRLVHDAGPVAFSGELGPELALLFASGDRVKNPRTSTRLEVGARAAVSLTWSMSAHLGAFVTLFGVWRPRPYEFRVNPELSSGTTPPVWLGASLGLAFRTR
jgi:hypothetical protein